MLPANQSMCQPANQIQEPVQIYFRLSLDIHCKGKFPRLPVSSKTRTPGLPVIYFCRPVDSPFLCHTYKVNLKAKYFNLEARGNIAGWYKLAFENAQGRVLATCILWNIFFFFSSGSLFCRISLLFSTRPVVSTAGGRGNH